jgi:hypothetical protein
MSWGAGGTGTVYRCVDLELSGFAAVKVFSLLLEGDGAEVEAAWRRFVDEARLLASSPHPQIVEIRLVIEGQPEEQRASFEAARAELDARQKQRGVRCGSGQRAAKSAAPAVAAASGVVTQRIEEEQPPPFLALGTTSPDEADHLPSTTKNAEMVPHGPPAEHMTTSTPIPSPQLDPRAAASRPMSIGGGVMLGLGLSLGGFAAYAGARSAGMARDGREIQAMSAIMPLDDAALREDATLADGYRTWTSVAITTAISGGVAVVIGAVLLGGRPSP